MVGPPSAWSLRDQGCDLAGSFLRHPPVPFGVSETSYRIDFAALTRSVATASRYQVISHDTFPLVETVISVGLAGGEGDMLLKIAPVLPRRGWSECFTFTAIKMRVTCS